MLELTSSSLMFILTDGSDGIPPPWSKGSAFCDDASIDPWYPEERGERSLLCKMSFLESKGEEMDGGLPLISELAGGMGELEVGPPVEPLVEALEKGVGRRL